MPEGDHEIPPIRIDQTMQVAVIMLQATISTFFKPEDDDKHKRDVSWSALAIFLHQLLMASKHKHIAIGILEAIIKELKDAQPI